MTRSSVLYVGANGDLIKQILEQNNYNNRLNVQTAETLSEAVLQKRADLLIMDSEFPAGKWYSQDALDNLISAVSKGDISTGLIKDKYPWIGDSRSEKRYSDKYSPLILAKRFNRSALFIMFDYVEDIADIYTEYNLIDIRKRQVHIDDKKRNIVLVPEDNLEYFIAGINFLISSSRRRPGFDMPYNKWRVSYSDGLQNPN